MIWIIWINYLAPLRRLNILWGQEPLLSASAFTAAPFPEGFQVLWWPYSAILQDVGENLEHLPQKHHLILNHKVDEPPMPHFLGICLRVKLMENFHLIFKARLNAYYELLLLVSDINFFFSKIIHIRWRKSLSVLYLWSEADQRGLINYSLWHFACYFTFYNYQSV